jgi:hypothetical protein
MSPVIRSPTVTEASLTRWRTARMGAFLLRDSSKRKQVSA